MMRSLACVAVVGLLTAAPSFVEAQEATTEDQMLDLLEQGTEASNAGNYPEAIKLLTAAAALGNLNVAHLNLGRAQQKHGDCLAAIASFEVAMTAPAYDGLSKESVLRAIETYRGELLTTCEGTLRVECRPGAVRLTIRSEGMPMGDRELSCAKPRTMLPGEYIIAGSQDGQTATLLVTIRRGETTSTRMELPPVTTANSPVQPPAAVVNAKSEPAPGFDPNPVFGWSMVGAGVLVVGAGLAVDQTVLASKYDELDAAAASGDAARHEKLRSEADTLETSELVLLIGGGVIAAAGGAWLLYDAQGSDIDSTAPSAGMSLWLSDEVTGAVLSAPW